MRTRIVPAGELRSSSLRAEDYVPCPPALANAAVDAWIDAHNLGPFIRREGRAIKDLKSRVAEAIEEAMRR